MGHENNEVVVTWRKVEKLQAVEGILLLVIK